MKAILSNFWQYCILLPFAAIVAAFQDDRSALAPRFGIREVALLAMRREGIERAQGRRTMSWTDEILKVVTDLGAGEDRLPLERVMRRHIGVFADLISDGRTWPQIASAMTKAGARHRRGQPIDPKQLRTVYGRLHKAQFAADSSESLTRNASHKLVKPQSRDAGAMQSSDIMSKLAEVKARRFAIKRDFDD